MYIFNRVTVVPKLPKRIEKITEISNNLWWSWNTELLRLFQEMDVTLWEKTKKNPIKFLKLVNQEKLSEMAEDPNFLRKYDKNSKNLKTQRRNI